MLKEKYFILSAAALALAINAFAEVESSPVADNYSSDRSLSNQPSYGQPSTDTTSTAEPQRKLSFSIYGDFLYWGTYFDFMPYYMAADNTPNLFATFNPTQVRVGWDPGFRIGLSYYDQDWRDFTTAVEWTRYYSNNSQVAYDTDIFAYAGESFVDTPSTVQTIYSYWGTVATTATGAPWRASYTYSQKFDEIDLLFKESFHPKAHWSLAATGGVRGVLNRQHFKVYQSRASAGSTITDTPPFDTTNVFMKQQFNAVGLLGGLRSTLEVGEGFAFYVGGNASLAFGKASSTSRAQRTIVYNNSGDPDVTQSLKASTYRALPILDLDAGIEWNDTFSDNTWGLSLKAAYEAHLFLNYPMFVYMQETFNRVVPLNTNMFFQGLTLRAGLEF